MKADWKEINQPFKPRIRYIVATKDFIIGDCYFGTGGFYPADPERNKETDWKRECWRYTADDRPVPDHLQPTHWDNLPDSPEKSLKDVNSVVTPNEAN